MSVNPSSGAPGALFSVDHNDKWPQATWIEFSSHRMRSVQQVSVRAVRTWIEGEMMERLAAHRTISENFHIPENADQIKCCAITYFRQDHIIVFGFVQMNGQLGGAAVFGPSDDHGDLASPSRRARMASRSRRSSSLASATTAGSTSKPAFALRAS